MNSTVGNAGYGIIAFSYDEAGRVGVKTDQQGDTGTYNFNLAGRLTSRDYAAHSTSPLVGQSDTDTFTYDDDGRMLTAVSGRYSNTVTFTHDDSGRVATKSRTVTPLLELLDSTVAAKWFVKPATQTPSKPKRVPKMFQGLNQETKEGLRTGRSKSLR